MKNIADSQLQTADWSADGSDALDWPLNAVNNQ
jgi:hypothetical protein